MVEKILIVDDEEDIRSFLRLVLESEGYLVRAAASAVEALQLMKEGAKWQIFIPSDLAYGDKGAGNVIGPNAVLVFDVELISVKEAEKK